MNRNQLQKGKCHVCNANYFNIDIGRKHIYGKCLKCQRIDEIGLVFYNA